MSAELINVLNEFLARDPKALELLLGSRAFANEELVKGMRMPSYRRLAGTGASVVGLLSIVNEVMANYNKVVVPVYARTGRPLLSLRVYDVTNCLVDPRPDVELLARIPGGAPINYSLHPPAVGDRVQVPLMRHALRNICPDAWIEMFGHNTRDGVMLAKEDDMAFVQFGDSTVAAPIYIQFLTGHIEDRRKRDEQAKIEAQQSADEKANGPAVQEVLPGGSGEQAEGDGGGEGGEGEATPPAERTDDASPAGG
jgi:hypothetical protein